ncbi:YDG/SRA domain-containing protein [Acrocarpospora sp. B8E8]|uniref:caspase, EACC1-associated type n=1 Tax=Acrocarpospora sp. B8E8 TaxID=3153572 RepID=UPI00325F812D
MSLPSVTASRVVLIGTSSYMHMKDLPAVENNLQAFRELFRDEKLWGLPEEHCTVVSNPGSASAMLDPVRTAIAAAEDTLIVYFAGHGLMDTSGKELYLTIPGSDGKRLYTAVAYEHLRHELLESRARNRIVILDCCYSARVLGVMSGQEDGELLADMAAVSGTYVMAASDKIALTADEYSEFSGELIRLIGEGIPDQPELLTVNNIFRHAQAALRDKGKPVPQKRDTHFTHNLFLVRNKWFSDNHDSPLIGPIDHPLPQTLYERRRDLHDAGVHRPLQAGICGTADRGAESIVVSGGYKDDHDYGNVIIYTGHGGRDPNTGRQVRDQSAYDSGNAALIKSIMTGFPVRVVRGSGGNPEFSPQAGYSYDGLYTVTDYWTKKGVDGFSVLQFRLEKQLNAPASAMNAANWSRISGGIYADLRLADKLNRIYDYSCQMCGVTLEAPGGLRFASAVHIQGLSVPHNGPDSLDNMLCLCSNHRDLFRYGSIVIGDALEIIDQIGNEPLGVLIEKHHINRAYLSYHRQHHSIYNAPT